MKPFSIEQRRLLTRNLQSREICVQLSEMYMWALTFTELPHLMHLHLIQLAETQEESGAKKANALVQQFYDVQRELGSHKYE